MIWKKIFLSTDKKKYCIVKVFSTEKQMQEAYLKRCPQDSGHDKVNGVSIHYVRKDGRKLSGETGTVLLSYGGCGAGLVSHELMHAVLWAYKHNRNKSAANQYPIIINSMEEEEKILQNHTYAVTQFYQWYYKKVHDHFATQ